MAYGTTKEHDGRDVIIPSLTITVKKCRTEDDGWVSHDKN